MRDPSRCGLGDLHPDRAPVCSPLDARLPAPGCKPIALLLAALALLVGAATCRREIPPPVLVPAPPARISATAPAPLPSEPEPETAPGPSESHGSDTDEAPPVDVAPSAEDPGEGEPDDQPEKPPLPEVPHRAGDRDPTEPRGVPAVGQSDPWDGMRPPIDRLLAQPVPLPGDVVSVCFDDAKCPSTISIRFDKNRHWDRPESCEDCGLNGFEGFMDILAARKVDYDRDGKPEVVLLFSENGGGNGMFQLVVYFETKGDRLAYVGTLDDDESYASDNWIRDVRRLGHCIELVGVCDLGWGPGEDRLCRMVFAWRNGRMHLAEYARLEPPPTNPETGLQDDSLPPEFTHRRDDRLMRLCGLGGRAR